MSWNRTVWDQRNESNLFNLQTWFLLHNEQHQLLSSLTCFSVSLLLPDRSSMSTPASIFVILLCLLLLRSTAVTGSRWTDEKTTGGKSEDSRELVSSLLYCVLFQRNRDSSRLTETERLSYYWTEESDPGLFPVLDQFQTVFLLFLLKCTKLSTFTLYLQVLVLLCY